MTQSRMPWLSFFSFLLLAFTSLFVSAHRGRCEQVTMGVIMPGTRYATTYYIKKGDQPGPTIVVIGGVHGDEIAGYRAAEQLVHWTVTGGTLVVLPDAHKEAIRRNVRGYPGNMNNMFPGKRDGSDMERLAYQIFEMVRGVHPNLLLTLHESREFHSENPKRYGQTFCYDFPTINDTMQPALDRVNTGIARKRDKFSLFIEPHPTCPTYQAWVQLKTPATSIETCRELPLPERIDYQLQAVRAFFDLMKLQYEAPSDPLLARIMEQPSTTSSVPIVKPVSQNSLPGGRSAQSNTKNHKTENLRYDERTAFAARPVVKVAGSFESRIVSQSASNGAPIGLFSLSGLLLSVVIFGGTLGSLAYYGWNFRRRN